MLNNFIYSKTKDLFLEQLEAGHVLDEAVAFIEDTKEIWNHGTYFDGTNVREYAFPKTGGLITGVSSYPLQLKSSSDIYSTIRFITNNDDYITFGFKNSDNPQLFFTNKNGWNNEYFLYHSGNFNPNDYFPKSGGTITGTTIIKANGNPVIQYFNNEKWWGGLGFSALDTPAVRFGSGGWSTILHSGNVGEYAALKDGSNASGTWGIDISGSAFGIVTNKKYNAAGLTETKANQIIYCNTILGSTEGMFPALGNYSNAVLTINRHPDNLLNSSQLGFSNNGNLYYRNTINTTTAWKTIAFTDSNITGNAATAYRLISTANIPVVSVSGAIFDLNRDYNTGELFVSSKMGLEIETRESFIEYKGYSTAKKYVGSIILNTSGNVTIGAEDLAGSDYKLYIIGGLRVRGAVSGAPTLGEKIEGASIFGAEHFGLQIWTYTSGSSNMQSGRFDGSATAYDLNLNPLGGAVNVGEGGLNVGGVLSISNKVILSKNSITTQVAYIAKSGGANYIWGYSANDYLCLGAGGTTLNKASSSMVVESNGLYPGTTNAVSLGTSSYRWSNLYSVNGSFSGRVLIGGAEDDGTSALQVKGDIHVTGNIIADGEVSAGGGISTTEDLLSYGVEWDTTQSTPDCTRIGNPLLHKSLPIQSKLRGCVANGNNINYYLYSEDWAYKEDGTTPSILDGTDGTVRVDTGAKFYIKSGSNGTKRWVRISTIQIDSSWIEVKRMLIDAYRCTVDTTDSSTPKTASVVNTSAEFRGGTNSSSYDSYLSTDVFRTQLGKPRTNVTRATMRTYAKNAGSQLLNYNDYKAVLYWLPVIEFATFNIQQSFNANPTSDGYKQGGLSAGVTNMGSTNWSNYNGYNPLTPCGYANSLGNHTGVVTFTTPADSAASVTAVTHSITRWRGFENIFGDIWTNLDGILIEYNATIGKHDVYSCDNSEYFADSLNEHYTKIGEQIASDGYIGEFDLGESAEIIPSSVGGSTTTKKCDYNYQTTSAGLRTLLVGGSANNGGLAGLGYFTSNYGVGGANANVGFRTSNYKD